MPFCPGCGTEYKEDYKECPDCELELRSAPMLQELEIDTDREYSTVYMTRDASQGRLIRGFLAEHGIKTALRDKMGALRTIFGSYSITDDTLQVLVLKEDEERAKKVLNEKVDWSENELAEYMKRTGELDQSDEPVPQEEIDNWKPFLDL